MKMFERFSIEFDPSVRMPSMVLISSSRMSVTSVSIVSGEAPGRIVVTVTNGKSTRGFKSRSRRKSEIKPSTTRLAISMNANTGRRIEISGRFIVSPPPRRHPRPAWRPRRLRRLHSRSRSSSRLRRHPPAATPKSRSAAGVLRSPGSGRRRPTARPRRPPLPGRLRRRRRRSPPTARRWRRSSIGTCSARSPRRRNT